MKYRDTYFIIILGHLNKEVRKITTPKKVGRPKIDNPKNVEVKVRFDELTNNKILKYCEKNKITRTELIRKGVNLVLETEKDK